MKKRTFVKQLAYTGIGLSHAGFLWSSCNSTSSQSAPEDQVPAPSGFKKWAWLRPPVDRWTQDDWKSNLAHAKNCGIDAIILECYNSTSTIFPHPDPQITMRANLLEQVIEVCKSNDLEIHAWMWTVPCNAEQVIINHPDWYAVNGLGQPAHTHPAYVDYYKFLDPLNPEVQQFIANNVKALAAYDGLDGIHLDYVRLPDVILAEALQPKYDIVQDREYPEYDYNYSTIARDLFKGQTGIDPLTDLEDPSTHEAWRQFRYDSITQLVNGHLLPEIKKRNKLASAAVFPNWESVRQQWHKWDLDAFFPMLYHGFYNRGLDFVSEHTKKGIERLDGKKPIYSGIFMPDILPDDMSRAFEEARSAGASGISIFDLGGTTPAQWERMKKLKTI